ncbi:MAG: tryptophan synthase alpha chain [Acidobacteriota bacterium]|jgi:tryptophan synthase alpha chain|nr:tryptophan synthase alpha chain [Acidobacteriota bacterium]
MTRIESAFARLRREGQRGLIPFITAGDPDLETTGELLVELARAGACIIELGVPFSDPMADGPVIQRASERALRHGFGIAEVLDVVKRAQPLMNDVPVVLFSYFNPLLQYGLEHLSREAKQAGVDGVLVTDLVPEEAEEFANLLRAHDLDMIFLVAPTSTDERLQMIAERASGFIYAVSRAGITGARSDVSREAEALVGRVRKFSELPVAVGFGISNAEQVAETWRYADAAVVGSALVAEIERLEGSLDIVERVGEFVRKLLPDGKYVETNG